MNDGPAPMHIPELKKTVRRVTVFCMKTKQTASQLQAAISSITRHPFIVLAAVHTAKNASGIQSDEVIMRSNAGGCGPADIDITPR